MKASFQWEVEIVINASRSRVWDVCDDLTLIPKYHPRVSHVEFISGSGTRAEGVAYRCHFNSRGRDRWCTERIAEYDPPHRVHMTFPEDNMGLSRLVCNLTSDLTLSETDDGATRVMLVTSYESKGIFGTLANALLRPIMRNQAKKTLQNLKCWIESDGRNKASASD